MSTISCKDHNKKIADNYTAAISWVLAHTILFSLTGVFIKTISEEITVFEQIFYRALFSIVVIITLTKPKMSTLFQKDALSLLIIRGGFGFLGMSGMFYSMQKLPLAIAMALTLVTPIFVMIFGRFFMHEMVILKALGSSCIALFGITLILNIDLTNGFSSGIDLFPVMIGLMGSISTAIAFLSMRAALKKVNTNVVVFWFAFGNFLGGGIFSLKDFNVPCVSDIFFILIICVLGLLSDFTKTTSYKYAVTWFVSLLSLISVFFSAVWGWTIFGDVILFTQVVGVLMMVIGVGLTIMFNQK